MVDIIERDKDFSNTIFNWLNNDKDFLNYLGLNELGIDKIIDWWNTSKIFEIRNGQPIGFFKLDLGSFYGVFHTYLIPTARCKGLLSNKILIKFLKFCFKELHLKNVYTLLKDKKEKISIFRFENRIVNNYYVYSVDKERILCL